LKKWAALSDYGVCRWCGFPVYASIKSWIEIRKCFAKKVCQRGIANDKSIFGAINPYCQLEGGEGISKQLFKKTRHNCGSEGSKKAGRKREGNGQK
jgi:hypothetical protein